MKEKNMTFFHAWNMINQMIQSTVVSVLLDSVYMREQQNNLQVGACLVFHGRIGMDVGRHQGQ